MGNLIRLAIALLLLFVLVHEAFAQNLTTARPEHARDDSLFSSGLILYGEGRYQQALAAFLAVSDSARPGLLQNIATVHLGLGDLRNAEKEFRRALISDSTSLRVRLQLAELLDGQGRSDEAEKLYREVVKRDSSLLPALQGLGTILMKKRKYAEAVEVFDRAILASPRNAGLYAQAGTALKNLGKSDSARTMLATSLALNPSNVSVMAELGAIYLGKKEYQDALRLFSAAAKAQPWNSEILFKAGLCEEKLSVPDDAADYFRRATLADTTNVLAFGHLGSMCFQRKLYDSSIVAYQAAAELEPDNPGIFINMGISYSCIDSIARAIACLRKAIKVMNPADVGAVYERIGALQLGGNHFAEAKESYRKAVLFDPGRTASIFYQAFCCDQLNQYDQAKKLYSAFLNAPKSAESDKERVAVARKRLSLLNTK